MFSLSATLLGHFLDTLLTFFGTLLAYFFHTFFTLLAILTITLGHFGDTFGTLGPLLAHFWDIFGTLLGHC